MLILAEPPESLPFRPSDGQRLRTKLPLPRSPLFHIQFSSTSPERLHSSSLSPRMSGHGTRGELISLPAPRRRLYRPRTISYSFVKSERTSSVHDDEQVPEIDRRQDGEIAPKTQSSEEDLRECSLRCSTLTYDNTSEAILDSSEDSICNQTVSLNSDSYFGANILSSALDSGPEQESASFAFLSHNRPPSDERCIPSPELESPFSTMSCEGSPPASTLDMSLVSPKRGRSQCVATFTLSTSLSASPYVGTERHVMVHCLIRDL